MANPKVKIDGKFYEIVASPEKCDACTKCAFYQHPTHCRLDGDCLLVFGCYFKVCENGSIWKTN